MSAERTLLLGIDIGGTKTAIVLGDDQGAVIDRAQFASRPERGPDAMLGDIRGHVGALLERHPGVVAIGACVGGPVDAEAGLVMGPPHLPGWDAVPLTAWLREAFGRPAAIEHDAKANTLAEWQFGAGRGARDMVFLTLGTGLGAGVIAGGRLLRGAGNRAGEIGHWRIAPDGPPIYGKPGSLEGWASGAGVAALARFLQPDRMADVSEAADLAARARAGDAAAGEVIRRAGEALGRGLALLVDLLAPEVIVLGNLARRLGPTFVDPARATLAAEALAESARRCRIVHCELGDALGDVASLCVAADAARAGL